MKLTMLAITLTALVAASNTAATAETSSPVCTPAQAGLDSVLLDHALNLLSVNGSETVQVYRDGCQVGKGVYDPVLGDLAGNNWSQTKTVTALLTGRAVTLGKLQVSDPIGKYLPPGLGDEAHRAITIEHLLTQTSGVHMNWSRELNPEMPDRIAEFMSLPIDHEPGTYFRYDQTGPTVLAYVVEQAVGEDLQEFAQREFFTPLGIPRDKWFWLRDRAGHTEGWAHLFLPGDQFRRFGELFTNDGVVAGKRLISSGYLRKLHTGTKANPAYGYLTWVNSGAYWVNASGFAEATNEGHMISSAPPDMYFSAGFHGQFVFVLPKLHMVVTRSSGSLMWTPSRTDVGDLTTAATSSQPGRIEYEFFKLIMHAAGQPAGDYVAPTPTSVDVGLIVNPEDNLAALQLGPGAPEGCTFAGCGSDPSTTEAVRFLQEVQAAEWAGFTSVPDSVMELARKSPRFFLRVLDGWEQTAQIMGKRLPDTVPNLMRSLQASVDTVPAIR
ncbi:hypothetical protein Lesp02_75680 [Lentzea sp. NBRC 105346]|uniref:serine hydrolase domain-containing protein n=1 Tax=Lentzea sp. NBRC 105346 TaxID=3032205 RepID=UPI00249FEBC4|nr:serine hydrolase [Lentzea sp. NBRC 105346]GLZ35381.1 hypothetical protein Lesp02_75680 [Lentzea sp. NBRC 105346]